MQEFLSKIFKKLNSFGVMMSMYFIAEIYTKASMLNQQAPANAPVLAV